MGAVRTQSDHGAVQTTPALSLCVWRTSVGGGAKHLRGTYATGFIPSVQLIDSCETRHPRRLRKPDCDCGDCVALTSMACRLLVTVAVVVRVNGRADLLRLNDVLEMCSNIPSWNTAKGVSDRSKCLGGKPTARNESKGWLGRPRWEGFTARTIVRSGRVYADRSEIEL